MQWIIPLIAGTLTGVLSAFGVGGGTLLLIYMAVFAGVPQQTAQGINLLYFLPASMASLPSHIKNSFIDKSSIWPAIIWGVLFTAGASFLATGLDVNLLHKCFGVFLVIIGLYELFGKKKTA